MKIPDVGDEVYIDNVASPYYGCRGKILSREEGRAYNYGSEYHYVILVEVNGWGACEEASFNDLEISFQRPISKQELIKKQQVCQQHGAIERIAKEIGHLTKQQQQECLGMFLFQAIDGKIDSAEVIKALFK